MSRLKHKANKGSKANINNCQTPQYALDPLFEYLDPDWIIWEPACGEGNLVAGLQKHGFEVVAGDIRFGQDFFAYEPDVWHCAITNPPYNPGGKAGPKYRWLERMYQLGKLFALLMPVDFMGTGGCLELYQKYGWAETILLDARVDFKTVNVDYQDSQAWFPVAWYTYGLNIGQRLSLGHINKRPDEQLSFLWQLPLFEQQEASAQLSFEA